MIIGRIHFLAVAGLRPSSPWGHQVSCHVALSIGSLLPSSSWLVAAAGESCLCVLARWRQFISEYNHRSKSISFAVCHNQIMEMPSHHPGRILLVRSKSRSHSHSRGGDYARGESSGVTLVCVCHACWFFSCLLFLSRNVNVMRDFYVFFFLSIVSVYTVARKLVDNQLIYTYIFIKFFILS